ncbi:MAG: flagellar hook-basal body complex protein [Lachnospiraceae bacterium]|nr:flagellar hook-basal body complex protein [Lachnospiraceae bacterium]
MMRSLYSGVSGLKTHQTKMDVIGNNIANVNTVAFKSQSITFSELMYQTTQKASGPSAETGKGGVNARQIGLGVKSGAINTSIASQGATQTTGNPFDLKITGEAFFVVSDGNSNFFTRDGSFYVDSAGNLAMTSNGYNVMGWQVDEETGDIKKDTVEPLRIMSAANLTYPPEETTKATISGVLDKNDSALETEAGLIRNLTIYDKSGYEYTVKLSFHKTTTDGEFYIQLDKLLDADGNDVTAEAGIALGTEMEVGVELSRSTITGYRSSVDNDGNVVITGRDADGNDVTINGTVDAEITTITEDMKKAFGLSDEEADNITKAKFDANGNLVILSQNVTGVSLNYDPNTAEFISVDGGDAFNLTFSSLSFSDISVNTKDTSIYNKKGKSTLNADPGDALNNNFGSGRKLGEMIGVSIQDNGMIYASYDNGMTKLLGQIAVAEFANASGLEKQGDNLYSATLNSGEFDGIGVDITASGGYMNTGVLEMSNVDLSAEFTEMITTQRGFQANSRIITVSDTLLEELVNLKR